MSGAQYDLSVQVNLGKHPLRIDNHVLLIRSEVVVLFQKEFSFQEVFGARHYQQLAFLDFLAYFLGIVSIDLSSDEFFNQNLVGRFFGR